MPRSRRRREEDSSSLPGASSQPSSQPPSQISQSASQPPSQSSRHDSLPRVSSSDPAAAEERLTFGQFVQWGDMEKDHDMRAIAQSIEKSKEHLRQLQKTIDSIEIAEKDKQQKEKESRKRKLFELYRDCSYQKCDCERVKEALSLTKRYQQRENGEDIKEYFKNELRRLDDAFAKKPESERLKDTAEEAPLQDYASLLGFGDIQIEALPVDLRCPISRTNMVNPTKNTACGHSYDERNIRELLGKKSTIRCPVAGCGAVVRAGTLVPDKELMKEIAKPQRMRSQRREGDDDEYAKV